MKKKIISPDDVLTILRHDKRGRDAKPVKKAQEAFERVHASGRDADVARDIKIGLLRAYFIDELVTHASSRFLEAAPDIMSKRHETSLMNSSELCDALKEVARKHAFANPAVLKMEAIGAAALDRLMCFFWRAITERKDFDDLLSRRTSAVAKYGWSLASPNYIEEAYRSRNEKGPEASVRYRELRLLTDMVSGMTDSFALKLWEQIKDIPE